MTTKRAAAGGGVLVLTLAVAACSPPEKRIVDQYFNALNAEDTQTLGSFAAVRFDKKVQTWKVLAVSEATKETAPLPDLFARFQKAEADVAANKKEAQRYSLDRYSDIERVRELRKKNASIPRSLEGVAEAWDRFNEKDRELKRATAEAKDAYEQEKRYVALSVGQIEGVENMSGEMETKVVDLQLTVEGQTQPYAMTLRRYNLAGETAQRVISRWVVFKLDPQA